jgi:hypothetical protein
MLCWILILGGLLIMMGHQSRSEALFYYFRLEDQAPENHPLRLIDKHNKEAADSLVAKPEMDSQAGPSSHQR